MVIEGGEIRVPSWTTVYVPLGFIESDSPSVGGSTKSMSASWCSPFFSHQVTNFECTSFQVTTWRAILRTMPSRRATSIRPLSSRIFSLVVTFLNWNVATMVAKDLRLGPTNWSRCDATVSARRASRSSILAWIGATSALWSATANACAALKSAFLPSSCTCRANRCSASVLMRSRTSGSTLDTSTTSLFSMSRNVILQYYTYYYNFIAMLYYEIWMQVLFKTTLLLD